MMTDYDQKKITPQERYNKKYVKQFKIDCVTRIEQDIQKLESVPNKAGYIKGLIRADTAAEKKLKNNSNAARRFGALFFASVPGIRS